MKKILNNSRADAIAVYNALDIASGGNLSLIKQSVAQTFHGFLEAKFNNLIEDIVSGGINEEELLNFINKNMATDGNLLSKIIFQNKEFISNLILKNMHADNRITTFLLAKLWIQKMKNNSLNYYESSLFANINTLTSHDYEVFYDSFLNISLYNNRQDIFQTTTSSGNEHYTTSLNKYKSIGIIADTGAFDGGTLVKDNNLEINFQKTPFSDIFFEYLREFFERG